MTTTTTPGTSDAGKDDEQYIRYLDLQALRILTRVPFYPMITYTRVQHDNTLSKFHYVFGLQTYVKQYMISRTEISVTRKLAASTLPRIYC
jgi:hypothetical protein